MKKKIVAVFIVVCMSIGMAACANSAEKNREK